MIQNLELTGDKKENMEEMGETKLSHLMNSQVK